MLHLKKSFTVPASAGDAKYCTEHGHTLPDKRGKCLRCGEKTTADAFVARLENAS